MDLTLANFVMLVIVVSFSLVLFCGMVSRYLHSRAEHRALSRRVICRLCLHAFEDSSRSTNVECPGCHAITEKGRRNKSAEC